MQGWNVARLPQAIFNIWEPHCCFPTISEAVISAILIPVLMLLPAITTPDTKETSGHSCDILQLMGQTLLRNTQALREIVLPERSQPVQGIADCVYEGDEGASLRSILYFRDDTEYTLCILKGSHLTVKTDKSNPAVLAFISSISPSKRSSNLRHMNNKRKYNVLVKLYSNLIRES